MANRYAKIEERLDALERAHAPKGRFIVGGDDIIIDEDAEHCDAYIQAHYDHLLRECAPITPQDEIRFMARVIVAPPDYDENDRPVPGTGSKSSTVKR